MDEVTSLTVATEPSSVEGSAELCFVPWVTVQTSELVNSVSELTLSSVSAVTSLLKRSAHLGFISTIVYLLLLRSVRLDAVSSL